DVRLRLRATRRRAVHRPLQFGAIDADRGLAGALEVLGHGAAGEAPCSDRDVERPPPGYDDLCDAASIRLRAPAPQAHRRTPDARAAIAVDDGDDEPHGATDLGQRGPLSMERRR